MFNIDHFVQAIIDLRDKQKEVAAAKGSSKYWVLVSEAKVLLQNIDRLIEQYQEEK